MESYKVEFRGKLAIWTIGTFTAGRKTCWLAASPATLMQEDEKAAGSLVFLLRNEEFQ